jgi:signal peptidase I
MGVAMTLSPRSLSVVLREALPVALIALLVFQGLRLCVAERYMVPTDSMEPCLHGDPIAGDVVLVEKLSGWLGPVLHRYDLVVVQSPEANHHHIVKRVVAFGGEYIRVEDGDLWVGNSAQGLRREMKDPLAARALRVPWFEYPPHGLGAEEVAQCLNAGAAELRSDGIALQPISGGMERVTAELGRAARRRRLEASQPRTLPTGFCGLARPVDSSWLDAQGRRGGRNGGLQWVNDSGAQLDLVAAADATAIVLALELRPDTFAWIWGADGSVRFLHDGEPVPGAAIAGPRWTAGEPVRVEYGFLDNRFFLVVDDRVVDLRVRADEWHGPEEGMQAHSGPRNLLYFAALGGGISIHHLQVFRDLYWVPERKPFREQRAEEVGPGRIWLLGDNSLDSQDSRSFGGVPLADYVGRPLLVLGPWSRHRLLRP